MKELFNYFQNTNNIINDLTPKKVINDRYFFKIEEYYPLALFSAYSLVRSSSQVTTTATSTTTTTNAATTADDIVAYGTNTTIAIVVAKATEGCPIKYNNDDPN